MAHAGRGVSGPVIDASFVDALALPRLVRLRPNLIGLAFPLMKLLPARYIVRKALKCLAISVRAPSTDVFARPRLYGAISRSPRCVGVSFRAGRGPRGSGDPARIPAA